MIHAAGDTSRKQVNPMSFSRLFGRKRQTGDDEGPIPLAGFETHSVRTVNVTPLAEEPIPAPVEPERPPEVPNDELRAVMKGLAQGLVEAWSGAVGQMQTILAADHTKLEAAIADMGRATDQLKGVTYELAALRERLVALEGDAIALRQSGQSLAARLDAQAEALRSLHSASQEREARLRDLVTTILKLADSTVSRDTGAKLPDAL